jgi:putative ABC transport system permease protein
MVKSSLTIKLIRDLKNLRFQIATTALLIICGVSTLVSSWSAYLSLKSAKDDFYQNSNFADIFAEFKIAPQQLSRKLEAISGIASVEVRIMLDGLVQLPDEEGPSVGLFVSMPDKDFAINSLYLKRGTLPTHGHLVEVCVHEAFAKAHDLEIGDELKIIIRGKSEKIKIVGIALSPEFVDPLNPSVPLPDNSHFGIFWLPRVELEYLATMQDQVNSLVLKISRGSSKEVLISEINKVLAPYGNRGAYERKRQLSNMFVEDEIRQQRVTGLIVPFIFLSIAAFLVNIIISRLIALQRPQVATLKALGYPDRLITLHYIKFISGILCAGVFPGIFLGGHLGSLMIKNYRHFFHFPELNYSVSSSSVLLGTLSGFLPGIIGGLVTLRSIFNLTPAEALRPPVPPEFLPTLFDRWKIERIFDVRSRMVIRNLLMKPIRLTVLIIGLSTSLAIIITSRSWLDMIHFLTTTQFYRQQREDVTVALHRPVRLSAFREFLRIDGVLDVETQRSLPIRIKYKSRAREISLIGTSETVQMTKILDKELRENKVPPHGILLSAFFRDRWGMKKGDIVDIDFLEGKLNTTSVIVAGFTEDLVGLSGHMNEIYLFRLLHENPSYNIFKLKIDPHMLSQIYSKLKTFPMITTVSIKNQLLNSFKDTIAGMVTVFTYILIAFALAITVGVLYNSVRVTFSERSWEMASLMILGLKQWRVFELLAAEVIIQVLLCIVPGCILGWILSWLSMKLIHAETFAFPIIIELRSYSLAILFVLLVMILSLWIIFNLLQKLKLSDALKIRE